jgi:hypothetical protein
MGRFGLFRLGFVLLFFFYIQNISTTLYVTSVGVHSIFVLPPHAPAAAARKSASPPVRQIRLASSARSIPLPVPAFPAAVLAAAVPLDPAPATPAVPAARTQTSTAGRPATPQRPRMEGCATKSRGWKVLLLLLLSPNRASAAPSNPPLPDPKHG